MNFIKKNYQGLLLCLLIGTIAALLGKRFSIIGGPVFAILLGLIIALFPRKNYFQSGITFTSKKYSNMQLSCLDLG